MYTKLYSFLKDIYIIRTIKYSGLFDKEYYLKNNLDVARSHKNPIRHFVRQGWKEGRNPSRFFDTQWYLNTYPDVKDSGMNPLYHFINYGSSEGRIFSPNKNHINISTPKSNKSAFIRKRLLNYKFQDIYIHKKEYAKIKNRADCFTAWKIFNGTNLRWRVEIDRSLKYLNKKTMFSVIVPVYNPPIDALNEAIESVISQTYDNFELILVDDKSTDPAITTCLENWKNKDNRIKLVLHEKNRHISAATNSGAEAASGDFFVFLDNDDKLHEDALSLFALYIDEKPLTDILYSDDAKINPESGELENPKFKPDWSPELLLSYCYISHLVAMRASLYREIGGCRLGFEGSQDHDLLLRAGEKARHIGHIPQILYYRRVLPTSTAYSGNAKPYSFEAGRRAVEEAFTRRGIKCTVQHSEWALKQGLGIYNPVMPDKGPSVAIIIPTKNNCKILDRLIQSLEKTTYQNYSVYIIDNMSDEKESIDYLRQSRHKAIRIPNKNNKFNYAYINNKAAEIVNEKYLLFLNNDTEVITPHWLSQMVGWAQLPDVGVVGARLLFKDGRVQHGGVVLGLRNGLTAFRGIPANQTGYLCYAKVTRNCSAVTAAALLTPKSLFMELGGFNENEFAVAYNDVDYCLRVIDSKRRVVYCGEAELYHHEGYSRPKTDNIKEVAALKNKYYNRKDPYYNYHLDYDTNDYSVKPGVVPPVSLPRPLRTLAITHNLNLEGAPNSAFELIKGLRDVGVIDPTVLSIKDGPLRQAYEKEKIPLNVFSNGYLLEKCSNQNEYDERIDEVTRLYFSNYDIIYANTAVSFWAIDAARRCGIPSIWNIRESESWENYLGNCHPDISECMTFPYRIVFVAKSTKKSWNNLDVLGNFEVINNGLDVNRFLLDTLQPERNAARKILNIDEKTICILLLGTICPRKGQHDLILAMEKLPPDIRNKLSIQIVGYRKDSYNEDLRKYINTLPSFIGKRINLVPVTDNTGLYWNAADIYVCNSRMESYPRVILEAMAKQLPIITTPVFGISEQVINEVNGLFYEPGNIDELAEKLLRLVKNLNMRKDFAKNSQDTLSRLLNYDEMISEYAKIFYSAYFSNVPHYNSSFEYKTYNLYTSHSRYSIAPLSRTRSYISPILRIPFRPHIRDLIKHTYFLLPWRIRNSSVVENLKNRFKSAEMKR